MALPRNFWIELQEWAFRLMLVMFGLFSVFAFLAFFMLREQAQPVLFQLILHFTMVSGGAFFIVWLLSGLVRLPALLQLRQQKTRDEMPYTDVEAGILAKIHRGSSVFIMLMGAGFGISLLLSQLSMQLYAFFTPVAQIIMGLAAVSMLVWLVSGIISKPGRTKQLTSKVGNETKNMILEDEEHTSVMLNRLSQTESLPEEYNQNNLSDDEPVEQKRKR